MRWLQSAATSGRSRRVNFGDAFCYFIHTLISKLTERLRRETKGTKNVLIDSENCGFTVLLSALFVRALNFQCVFCCLVRYIIHDMMAWRTRDEETDCSCALRKQELAVISKWVMIPSVECRSEVENDLKIIERAV